MYILCFILYKSTCINYRNNDLFASNAVIIHDYINIADIKVIRYDVMQ